MNVCPNIKGKEWKVLVAQVGEDSAWATWQYHNFDFPLSLTNTSTIKKEIGIRSNMSELQVAMMAKRLTKYNDKNGTSHTFDRNKMGQANLYNPVLKVNYFPKSITTKIINDGNMAVIGNSTAKAFINNNPSLFIQEGNQFFKGGEVYATLKDALDSKEEEEDGDYLPDTILGSPKKLSPKFQELANKYTEKVKLLHKSINLLNTELKSADVEEKVNLTKRIGVLKNSIEKIVGIEGDIENKGLLNEILKLNALEDVSAYAEEQFEELVKIFEGDHVSDEDMAYARQVTALWIKAGDFSQTENIFWDADELSRMDDNEILQQVKVKFNDYRNRAEYFNRRFIIPIEESLIEESLINEFDPSAINEINKPFKDINWATKMLLDASEINDPVIQVMSTYLHRATFLAHQESISIADKIDQLIKKAGVTSWELFEQEFSNTDKRKTGNLVFRFSQEYYEEVREKFNRARVAPVGESKRKAYKEAIDFVRENSLIFDVRKLFTDGDLWGVTYTTDEVNAHIAELKGALGEQGYETYYEQAKEKIEQYKLDREAQRDILADEYHDNEELIKAALSQWEANNSPAAEAELVEKGYPTIKVEEGFAIPTGRYSVKIPKRYNNGKETGFYDKKFEKIENNKDVKALYDYIFSTIRELNSYLPKEKVSWMQVNSLPTIYNTIVEDFSKSKGHSILTPLMDSLKEATRMSDLGTVDTRNRDAITGEPTKAVQTQMIVNYNSIIEEGVNTRIIEYKQAHNGESPSYEEIVEFKKEEANEFSKLKTFDLGKLTKAYAHMALTYKHKEALQPIMEAANNHLNRKLEQQQNIAGKDLQNKSGDPIVSKGLVHLKEMLDTVMDTFYGYSLDKPSGATNHAIYTSREQLMKDRLTIALSRNDEQLAEGIVTEEEHEVIRDILQDQLDVLGGVRVWSKWGDLVLQYVQLKGMGWNVFAGAANMLYGFISNITEASDGRNYNMEEFWKAQGKVMHTIGGINKFSSEAKKIKALMRNLNVLKDSRNELFKPSIPNTLNKTKKALSLLDPYKPQSSTEYINQATVMVAMLIHQKVMLEGKEVSMYDAYDNEGKLKEGTTLPDKVDEGKIAIKIYKVTKMNHGNYDPDNTIMAKRYLLGRALSQFRTWAYQGFAERFMGEMDDWQLGMKRKGRWISMASYYKTQKENNVGFINSTFYLTKQLMRKATFGAYNTQFDEVQGLSEVDAANMRKNMTEIIMYVTMTIMALLLKATMSDDKTKAKYVAFFWINQLTRLNTDMAFYISPVQFEKLTKNAMPAFTAVIDTENALYKCWNYILDSDGDIIQQGVNKGNSKALTAVGKVIPNPITQVYGRLKSASTQIYGNRAR